MTYFKKRSRGVRCRFFPQFPSERSASEGKEVEEEKSKRRQECDDLLRLSGCSVPYVVDSNSHANANSTIHSTQFNSTQIPSFHHSPHASHHDFDRSQVLRTKYRKSHPPTRHLIRSSFLAKHVTVINRANKRNTAHIAQHSPFLIEEIRVI